MKISLNVSERLFAINILNQFKGSHETLSFILDDIKGFAITEADWKAAKRVVKESKDDKGQPVSSWIWNDEKGGVKEIVVSEQVTKYLVDDIEKRNKEGEFTLQDKAVITLNKKLIDAK